VRRWAVVVWAKVATVAGIGEIVRGEREGGKGEVGGSTIIRLENVETESRRKIPMKRNLGVRASHDPRHSWIFVAVLGLVALAYVGIVITNYLGERRERMIRSWPTTRGVPVTTRVVRETATRTFPYAAYGGECSVKYTVDGKDRFLWVGTGYMDPDPGVMADKMQECPIPRYVVHYNPKEPADAVAERFEAAR
jgi:hypothetical protein